MDGGWLRKKEQQERRIAMRLSNVAWVPLCPAMTRSGMTIWLSDRSPFTGRHFRCTIIALGAIAGHRGTHALFGWRWVRKDCQELGSH